MENTAPMVVGDVHPAMAMTAAPPRVAAGRKLLLMIGAWSGVVGALLAFAVNALHPNPTDFRLEALLQEIARSTTWGSLHLTFILAVVLILGALVAITFTIDGEPGATVARFACVAALLGGALMLVSTALDGFAMPQVARAWLDAPAAEKTTTLRIAAALEQAQYAVFSLSIVLFLGIGMFLYGLATVLISVYPKALGWLALLAGAGTGWSIVSWRGALLRAGLGPDHRLGAEHGCGHGAPGPGAACTTCRCGPAATLGAPLQALLPTSSGMELPGT